MAELYANDRASSRLVGELVQVVQLEGTLAPGVAVPSVLPQANAAGIFGAEVSVQGREILWSAFVRAGSVARREDIIEILMHAWAGLQELRTDAAPDRVMYGHLGGPPVVQLIQGVFAIPTFRITVRWLCPDPARYEREPRPYALSAAACSIPVGTMACAPDVFVMGAATPVVDPVILLYNAAGDEVSRLTLSVSLGSTAYLHIKSGPQLIDHYVAGVLQTGASNGLTTVVSGLFPVLDPQDAAPDVDAWGTMALSSASGTPTGLALVRRIW